MSSQANKWDAIYADQQCDLLSAAEVVEQNIHLLPASGVALDMACGLGANAIRLAMHGLNVHAWDVSSVALEKINQYSQQHGLGIVTKNKDVENNPPNENSYNVVVVSNFLYRPILNSICNSLKQDGLLFYQTFTTQKVESIGPTNPDYLLNRNELLAACSDMEILVYREEGLQGNVARGWRNQAMIVAKRIT